MRDAEATRRRILEAARAEFAQYGHAGARINRIAAASGANKERIYANFGSKEQLFEAVMRDALAAHASAVGELADSAEELVDRLQQTHQASPDLLRLMLWEALEYGAGPVPDEARRRTHYRERVSVLRESFGFKTDVEAATALFTLIGLAAWPAVMPQLENMLVPQGQRKSFESVRRESMHRLASELLKP